MSRGDAVLVRLARARGALRGIHPVVRHGRVEEVAPHGFDVVCFPVKVHRGSAGWTRAVAIIRD